MKKLCTSLLALFAAMALLAQTATFYPVDSPDRRDYDSNTYDEEDWTEIAVTESFMVSEVKISYVWNTDDYPEEGSFWLESPEGTVAEIASDQEDGTYSITLNDFVGENANGTWILWIEDNEDDGGHEASDITVEFYSIGPSNPNPSNGATEIAFSGNLTWDFSDGAFAYDLMFGPAGNMSKVVSIGGAGTSGSYSYSGLGYDAEMEWQVIEYYTHEIIEGIVWSFTTYSKYAANPSPADNATDVAITTTFDWDDVYGADSYTITIGTSIGASDVVNGAACATSNYTYASNLLPGIEYFWTVTTIISGNPIAGTEWSFTTLDGKADNPVPADNVTGVAITAKTLNWDDMPNASGYKIDIGTTTGGSDIINDGASSTSDYTYSSNWTPGTEYFWTVTCTIDGNDYTGDEWSFTSLDGKADNPVPADNVTGVAITAKTLNWDDMPNASGYKIDIGTTNGGTQIADGEPCATSDYTVSNNWTPATEYFWKVTCTIDGNDYTGDEWSFITYGKAENPSPSDGADFVITSTPFDWDDVVGASGYTIDIGSSSGASDIVNDAACSTSDFTPASGFNTNSTIYWTVTSIINGSSYAGHEWSFTTSALINNQISSLSDLSYLTQHTALWNNNFTQTADIDASATQYWDYSDDNTDGDRYNDYNDATDDGTNDGWWPIGNNSTKFSGIYDGVNHTISNLFIKRNTTYQGFVGYLTGSILNLGITNLDYTISGLSASIVGGICGYQQYSNSLIDNCYTTGSISATGNSIGGIMGWVYYGTITNSYSTVSIEGNGNATKVGGFAGQANGTIQNCYSTGDITNIMDYSGGFCGYKYNNSSSNVIGNCYSTGSVSRAAGRTGTNIAAFVYHAYSSARTINCYCTGSVTFEGTSDPVDRGFGRGSGTFTNNFWNSTSSNQTSATGATALTNDQMQDYTNFTAAGWDFYNTWSISPAYNSGWPNLDDEAEPLTWTGASGTAWGTDGNWSGNSVPLYIHDVVIPASGVTQFPVIASANGYNTKGLTVNSGASLTINSGGSLITNGTITNNGTITVEHSMSDENWHLFSTPNNNTTANSFMGDYMQYWTENGQFWTDIDDPETSLAPMQGYSVWGTAKGDYSFTGTPNTGEKNITLSYHLNGDENKTADGMNLVGNPYPSSIDWALLQPTYGTAYVWNPGTTNYIYNTDADIAPMQGFFIYTTNNERSFTLQNSHRSHGGTFYKEGKVVQNGLILTATYGNFKDEWILKFDETADDGFTLTDDSWKLISDYEGVSQLWSESPDGKLAIDKRPETETIQLGFANNKAGSYSIALKEMADISTAMLEDTKTNTFHNLQAKPYEFTWDPMMDNEKRFKLHLNAVGIEETPISENNILIYAANNQIFIKGAEACQVKFCDLMGRIVLEQKISGKDLVSIPVNLQTGVYVVMVQNGKEIKTEKVFIK